MSEEVVQSRPTVYVIQEVMRRDQQTGSMVRVHNLKPALEFGNLTFLLDNRRFPINTAPVVAELKEKLAGYTPRDYILPVGSPAHIMIVGIIAAGVTGGKVRILKWDRPTQRYLEQFVEV